MPLRRRWKVGAWTKSIFQISSLKTTTSYLVAVLHGHSRDTVIVGGETTPPHYPTFNEWVVRWGIGSGSCTETEAEFTWQPAQRAYRVAGRPQPQNHSKKGVFCFYMDFRNARNVRTNMGSLILLVGRLGFAKWTPLQISPTHDLILSLDLLILLFMLLVFFEVVVSSQK